jgi:hypothetical protein
VILTQFSPNQSEFSQLVGTGIVVYKKTSPATYTYHGEPLRSNTPVIGACSRTSSTMAP